MQYMKYIRNQSLYLPVEEDAARQYIDARSTYTALMQAVIKAKEVRGGLYWKKKNNQTYLIRTATDNSQKSLGPKTDENEQIYKSFVARKTTYEARLNDLKKTMEKTERLNRALRVGRVPNIVVRLLRALEDAEISDHFIVVGTHALYAYETEAGVLMASAAIATQDIDLLWDTRKRFKLATQLKREDISIIDLLKNVDKSFQIRDDQKYTAVNSAGFEVDIIRREVKEGDPHPIRISHHEDDFWVTQAKRAEVLINAQRFSSIVVATNGEMAQMNTIAPQSFVDFKKWLANQKTREPIKRSRDKLQAQAVEQLISDGLLN